MSIETLAPGTPIDLTNCDREPIHIPGSIQPHGLFLALSDPDLTVLRISQNVVDHLGLTHLDALSRPLDALLDDASMRAVREALRSPDPRAECPIRLTSSSERGGKTFDGILHQSGTTTILELEPASVDEISFGDFYKRVRGAVSKLQRSARIVEMCQTAVDEVASMTGFDRVMAYRFDPDDHGHVIAEAKRPSLESYLDLHYPASDIPAQARRLYTLNWLRLIADVGYRPSPILPDVPGQPLDLSFAVLRSVSPIHIEYLSNMGICASMSVSLVVEGRLWGLIICHHYSPRFVSYQIRNACEFLGQTLSWQVSARERADAFERRAGAQRTLTGLIETLSTSSEVAGALLARGEAVLSLCNATGAALRVDGVWSTVGLTPAASDLDVIEKSIRDRLVDGVVATDCLTKLVPSAQNIDAVASGLLAVALAHQHGDLILWFRPEEVQSVSWAGDPNKLVSLADGDARLSPRGSFALWRETVRSRSTPWNPWEIEAASDLRRAVVGQVLRRNSELAITNARLEENVRERTRQLTLTTEDLARQSAELTASNAELERFAYVASHDLQEPLRMVVSYVQLLARRYQGKLDADADDFIGFAVDGAKRMQTLINDLLAYSRVGRQGRHMTVVDLERIFTSVIDNLSVAITEAGAEITHDPLPRVKGDATELAQLFQNLLSNALKFHGPEAARVNVKVTQSESEWSFSVSDNGIGVAPEYAERVFVLFQRLHTRAEFPGSGVGLAICKKIVEHHRGRIELEHKDGPGSTIIFTLPRTHEVDAS